MAATKAEWVTVADLRGGRNGTDPPVTLRPDECADAVNVDWATCLFGNKRGGANTISMTFSNTANVFTGTVSALGRHVPSSDDTAAEMWAVDSALTMGRFAANTWSLPTLKDALTGNSWNVSFASLDGKCFIAYRSAVDRLHCWDGVTVRRTGIATPSAPTANDAGSGSFAPTLRYYRMRWTTQVTGNVTTRRSEPSAPVAFTPSGSANGANVAWSIPAAEGETHWELEASLDAATYYVVATVPVSNTSYEDQTATTDYTNYALSASTGTFSVQKSYKFIAVDQNRLLGFGSYSANNRQNRIEFSGVVGSLNQGDAERVPTTNFLDLDENDSGQPTGLLGPLNGSFFAFKQGQFWKLTPTGDVTVPYSKAPISKTVGAVGPRAIVIGEDESGAPCIYWMSDRGPYRWGQNGLEYIGYGVQDLLQGPTSYLNTAATVSVCHAVYHADKRQVWFFVSVGTHNEPELKLVYNIGRIGGGAPSDKPVPSGWSQHTGPSVVARASLMFSGTIGTTLSRRMKPYIAYHDAVNAIWRLDTDDTTDAGTPFQSYITSRAYVPWGVQRNGDINRSYVLAKTSNGVTFSQTITTDYDEQTVTSNVALTSSQRRSRQRFEDSGIGDIASVQFTWGDLAAVASRWEIDAVAFEWLPREIA